MPVSRITYMPKGSVCSSHRLYAARLVAPVWPSFVVHAAAAGGIELSPQHIGVDIGAFDPEAINQADIEFVLNINRRPQVTDAQWMRVRGQLRTHLYEWMQRNSRVCSTAELVTAEVDLRIGGHMMGLAFNLGTGKVLSRWGAPGEG